MVTTIYQYIDTHAHLFYPEYKDDINLVLERAEAAGVTKIIVPGTDVASSLEAITMAERFENLYAAVGIHPHEAAKTNDESLKMIEDLCKHPKVVAIGEIGLDYYYDYSPRDQQKELFKNQLGIAVRVNKPVVIHTRESSEDAYAIVRSVISGNPEWKKDPAKSMRGVFHCFPGTSVEASDLSGMGFFVSYPGIVTFKKSTSLEVVKEIGVSKILLETDAPYMTPVPFRGKRNEPSHIPLIGKKIADALGVSEEEVARTTTANANLLFDI
jgi:TatD DNase family protein